MPFYSDLKEIRDKWLRENDQTSLVSNILDDRFNGLENMMELIIGHLKTREAIPLALEEIAVQLSSQLDI